MDVQNGLSLREAAEKNDVNYSTLHYRIQKKNVLKKNALSNIDEKLILEQIEKRQKGAPLTRQELIDNINNYVKVIFFYYFSFLKN